MPVMDVEETAAGGRAGDARSDFHMDARRAVEALGPEARRVVGAGTWFHFGTWLEWPAWLTEDTSHAKERVLPRRITVADDLLVGANLLARLGAAEVLRQVMRYHRPAIGHRASILCASAPSVGEALTVMCGGTEPSSRYLDFQPVAEASHFELRVRPLVELGRLGDFLQLLVLVLYYKIAQAIAPGQVAQIRMETTLRRDALPEAVWAELGCEVLAGAAANRLLVPATLALRANPEGDPSLWLLARELVSQVSAAAMHGALASRIRARAATLLVDAGQALRLKQVAAEEGLSVRTINRMLADEGTSFFEIVDQERRKRAAELVNNPAISLEGIATQLGFSDQSSFGRSFRKWFGTSPGQFRAARGRRQGVELA